MVELFPVSVSPRLRMWVDVDVSVDVYASTSARR